MLRPYSSAAVASGLARLLIRHGADSPVIKGLSIANITADKPWLAHCDVKTST